MKKKLLFFGIFFTAFFAVNIMAQPVPYLSYPVDGATVYDMTPQLNWYITTSGAGVTYNLQLSTDNTFTTILYEVDDINALSHDVTLALTGGTTYYWRVRSKIAGSAYSEFSTFEDFVTTSTGTGTPKAILSYPVDDALVYTQQPQLYWYITESGDGVTYSVEIDDENTFTAPIIAGITGDLTLTVPGPLPILPGGAPYYWRVASLKGANPPVFSDPSTFIINSTGTGTPKAILSYPVDDALVYTQQPQLYWYITESGDGVTYSVEIDDENTFTAPIIAGITGDLTLTVPGPLPILPGGAPYYWRVVSLKGANPPVFSDPSTFIINSTGTGTPKAILSYPVDDALVYTQQPQLYWYITEAGDGVQYGVEIDDENTFTAPTQIGPTANLTLTVPAPLPILPGGAPYYWRVVSLKGANPPVFSDPSTFVINSSGTGTPKAILSYPVDDALVYTQQPQLYWYITEAGDGVQYGVEIDDENTFTAPTQIGPTANLTLTVPAPLPILPGGAPYYWRVVSLKGANPPVFSDPSTFKINSAGTAAPLPYLSYPVEGAMVYSTTPQLYWYITESGANIEYSVLVDNDINFASPEVDVTDLNTLSYTVLGGAGLTGGQTYYWKVISENTVTAQTEESDVETFEIAADAGGGGNPPTVPDLLQPADAAVLGANPVNFEWAVDPVDATLVYNLQVSTSNTFSSSVLNVYDIAGLTYSTAALPNNTYFWRVQSKNTSNVSSDYSAFSEFTLAIPGPFPLAPVLGNPVGGRIVDPENLVLSWGTRVPDFDNKYRIQISDKADFSNILFDQDELSSKVINVESLPDAVEYYWRVESENPAGYASGFNYPEKFRLSRNITLVEQNNSEVPEGFKVEQNYPNPFNPSTMISFSISEASVVSIRIYDLLGREIKNLLSEGVNAGRYSVQWNGDDNSGNTVSSGTYIYTVSAGSDLKSFKMMLLK